MKGGVVKSLTLVISLSSRTRILSVTHELLFFFLKYNTTIGVLEEM